jgi:hypothetical protein
MISFHAPNENKKLTTQQYSMVDWLNSQIYKFKIKKL